MKNVSIIAAFLFLAAQGFSQGIDFFHGSWDEALAKAKAENKALFVDAYTTWCGPCKRMSSQVFVLPEVGEFYNANFINVKIDMEKGDGPQVGQKYSVRSYPTFLFINPNGEVAHRAVGGRDGEAFIALGQEAAKKTDASLEIGQKYEAGDRSPELVYQYVKALNKAGKPSLKVVNDYLVKNKDLGNETTLKIIFEGATECDSKVFDLMIKNRGKIEGLVGRQQVEEKILLACVKTAQKSIEFDAPELVEEAKKTVKKEIPAESDVFNWKCDMASALQTKNADAFMKAAVPYAKQELSDKPADLYALAKRVKDQFGSQKTVWKSAGDWAALAATADPSPVTLYLDAWYTWKNGNEKKAKSKAEQALSLAQADRGYNPAAIQQLLEDIGK